MENIFEQNRAFELTEKPFIVEDRELYEARKNVVLSFGKHLGKSDNYFRYCIKRNGQEINKESGIDNQHKFWYYDDEQGILHLYGLKLNNPQTCNSSGDNYPSLNILQQLFDYYKQDPKIYEKLKKVVIEKCIINTLILSTEILNTEKNKNIETIFKNIETIQVIHGNFTTIHLNQDAQQKITNFELHYTNVTTCTLYHKQNSSINNINIIGCRISNFYLYSSFDVLGIDRPIEDFIIGEDNHDLMNSPILNLKNLDFSKLTLNIDDFDTNNSTFINCENLEKVRFDKEANPKTKRHLLKRIGVILRKNNYIPEAEAVFDEEMKIFAELLETKSLGFKNTLKKMKLWFKNILKKIRLKK